MAAATMTSLSTSTPSLSKITRSRATLATPCVPASPLFSGEFLAQAIRDRDGAEQREGRTDVEQRRRQTIDGDGRARRDDCDNRPREAVAESVLAAVGVVAGLDRLLQRGPHIAEIREGHGEPEDQRDDG